MMRKVLTRYKGNPIIKPSDMPYPCETVYNSGVAKYNGKYVLLLRCGRLNGMSEFGLATSDDGFHFKIHPEPVMKKATEGIFKEPENKGVEDPRITQIGDTYYIFYSCYSTRGFQMGLAKTKDFLKIDRIALTTAIDYRNCVLFPEKIDGMYVRFERPNWGRPCIWISYSPDLIHWGNQQLIMAPDNHDIWQDREESSGREKSEKTQRRGSLSRGGEPEPEPERRCRGRQQRRQRRRRRRLPGNTRNAQQGSSPLTPRPPPYLRSARPRPWALLRSTPRRQQQRLREQRSSFPLLRSLLLFLLLLLLPPSSSKRTRSPTSPSSSRRPDARPPRPGSSPPPVPERPTRPAATPSGGSGMRARQKPAGNASRGGGRTRRSRRRGARPPTRRGPPRRSSRPRAPRPRGAAGTPRPRRGAPGSSRSSCGGRGSCAPEPRPPPPTRSLRSRPREWCLASRPRRGGRSKRGGKRQLPLRRLLLLLLLLLASTTPCSLPILSPLRQPAAGRTPRRSATLPKRRKI